MLALTCERGSEVIAHHNGLRNIVFGFFKQADLNSKHEAGDHNQT